ncbi:FAD-binding oxidoreductase [Acidocella aminolytica]|uniref:Oxidoreductase FAD-binding subunit n=1 Tax=Acidocella aminolytica 101 = DSM 11237 TaxID=1120923 RepID=A0A0D6PKE1_9PROT|nr:2Fe-2S iron-sulfur cluster binding domain-containing protein [Acidocella aminolytica]GAN81663.1 oxidoreductase FAD-binding subunit [Acidocella aminolytica 101 = DSM 11237]GBQ43105.1 2-polyprenylphenol hydroxylase [Acidocella aminolytica 101 = DSM 11237]SHF53599.1 NAD(P)H-flavin reductase [Acidocella aminolytica 101 = DSM 11237]
MNVTLITNDAVRLDVACAEGQNIMAAAEAAGLYPPAMCHEGSCGLCAAHVLEGSYEMGPHNPQAIPTGPGGVLLCRCQPQGDVTVALPYADAQISRQQIPEREAVITGLKEVAAGTVALSLLLKSDPVMGQGAEFVPGQYMELSVPSLGVKRAYSLANLPNWEGHLEFLIRLVPGGAFTGWLSARAKVGDELMVRGPLGSFVLDEASPRPRVLVAGGCGMAPILSMLRHMGEFQDSTPVHLIYAANREQELLPDSELETLRAALPQLGVTLAVWHPQPGWFGFTGTAADALEAYLIGTALVPDIYVCGPPRMLESIEAVALDKAVPETQLYAERLPH